MSKEAKTYYLTNGGPGVPAAMCTGVPGESAWYAPDDTEKHLWVRYEDYEAQKQRADAYSKDYSRATEEADRADNRATALLHRVIRAERQPREESER